MLPPVEKLQSKKVSIKKHTHMSIKPRGGLKEAVFLNIVFNKLPAVSKIESN